MIFNRCVKDEQAWTIVKQTDLLIITVERIYHLNNHKCAKKRIMINGMRLNYWMNLNSNGKFRKKKLDTFILNIKCKQQERHQQKKKSNIIFKVNEPFRIYNRRRKFKSLSLYGIYVYLDNNAYIITFKPFQ
jgi:hypothetical protein